MRRMISASKLAQIENSIEDINKEVPTSLKILDHKLYLEHDSKKLTGQNEIELNSDDFIYLNNVLSVDHTQYFNHFVTIKLTGDGEYYFCLNIIDKDNTVIDSGTDIISHLKGRSPYAQVTGYLKMSNGDTFQPMYIDDTLKVHGYLNGTLSPIQLITTDDYTLNKITDNVTLL